MNRFPLSGHLTYERKQEGQPDIMADTQSRLLDEYLVVSAQAGDRAAWNRLARRWQMRLVAHSARLLGDPDKARDAAQDAWAEIIRGLRGLQDARAFPAWAYRIASRACARKIARAVQDRELKQAVAQEPHVSFTAPELPSEMDRLKAAIRHLPAGERAAIALYHFEELRVAEVAVALDVPVGTVKTRLLHARRKLRAILEGEQP